MSKYNDHGSRFGVKYQERAVLDQTFYDFVFYYPVKATPLLLRIHRATLFYRKLETEWVPEKLTPLCGGAARMALSRLTQDKIILKSKLKGKDQVVVNIPGIIQWCLQYLYIPDKDQAWASEVMALRDKFMKLWEEEDLPMRSIKSKKPKLEFALQSIESKDDSDDLTRKEKEETERILAAEVSQRNTEALCDQLDGLCACAKKPCDIPKGAVSKAITLIKRFTVDEGLDLEAFNPDSKSKIFGQLRNFMFEQVSVGYSPAAIFYQIVQAWRQIRARERLEPTLFSLPWLLNNKSLVMERTKRFIEWQLRKEERREKSLGS